MSNVIFSSILFAHFRRSLRQINFCYRIYHGKPQKFNDFYLNSEYIVLIILSFRYFKELEIVETTKRIRFVQPNGDDSIQIRGHILKCDKCNQFFTQKYKLLIQHSNEPPYECWLCHKL